MKQNARARRLCPARLIRPPDVDRRASGAADLYDLQQLGEPSAPQGLLWNCVVAAAAVSCRADAATRWPRSVASCAQAMQRLRTTRLRAGASPATTSAFSSAPWPGVSRKGRLGQLRERALATPPPLQRLAQPRKTCRSMPHCIAGCRAHPRTAPAGHDGATTIPG
jgi:hypothetical protein